MYVVKRSQLSQSSHDWTDQKILQWPSGDVGTFDVPGAYLHAKITEGKTTLLKLQGCFVDIMCDVNP